jgi:hypothetical protein
MQLRQNGRAYAEADRVYQVKRSEVALRLKGEGMAIGMINMVIRGLPEVERLRFEREVAQVVYDANKEALNSYKLQLRLVEAQLQREWGQAGTGSM